MTGVTLRLGPLAPPGFAVRRSGLRWLCEDGHRCRAGEVVAFCNIGVAATGRQRRSSDPFLSETRDFQVGFAPRRAGVISRAERSSRGGFLDRHHNYQPWQEDFAIGTLELPPDAPEPEGAADELRLLFTAGRRFTEVAEVRTGLLTGWHDRSRAWWGEGEAGTLLSLGICEQVGIIRGEAAAFLELFEAVAGPAHCVFVPDDVLLPSAAILAEQIGRNVAEVAAIAADFARSFAAGTVVPTAGDWLFAGALLSAVQRSPLTERYDLLTRGGLRQAGPADAVLLSVNAETPRVLRHRRLGYTLNCHRFRIAELGPAVADWFRRDFEPVRRAPEDVLADYRRLIAAMRAHGATKFLVLNAMSTLGGEDVHNYAGFDQPMGDSLATVRNKDLNLMLHDLARDGAVAIVELDAIAAEIGASAHLPDGIHQSGALQAELRGEVLRQLRLAGVRGFSPPPSPN